MSDDIPSSAHADAIEARLAKFEGDLALLDRLKQAESKLRSLQPAENDQPRQPALIEARVAVLEQDLALAQRLEQAEDKISSLKSAPKIVVSEKTQGSLCLGLFVTGACFGLIAGMSEHVGISSLLLSSLITFIGGVFLGRKLSGEEVSTERISGSSRIMGWYLASFSGGVVLSLPIAAYLRVVGISEIGGKSQSEAPAVPAEADSDADGDADADGVEKSLPADEQASRHQLSLRGGDFSEYLDSFLTAILRLRQENSESSMKRISRECDTFLDPRVLSECSNAYSVTDGDDRDRAATLNAFIRETIK